MAGDRGGGGFYSGDCVEAVAGVLRDVGESLAVGTQAGADGGFQAGGLGVAAGGQAAVGQHQGDEFGGAHQNIEYS
ncbi:hypothetical protein ACQHIV_10945 [Kribbella sp. GL6]|uniref:hypothetical protein n=1 Tax=Kribbella sp. GL6 TaxID=3419765 RepID=UPI003CFE139B